MLFSKIIKKKFDAVLGRYEGDPAMVYPTMADVPELQRRSFDVQGERGVTLKGWFYSCGEPASEKLVVFDHGIGAGHLAYLREIAALAARGYTVYSYDHTGCVSTSGSGILGFAQGICDLDRVLTVLGQEPDLRGKPVQLVGHSWGGYAAMNAAALHPEVTHVVSLAGFLSARALIEQYIPRPFLKYSEEVMERERQHNPSYADMDARESLQKSGAKLLYLQSRDDVKVRYSLGTEPLSAALAGRAGTEFVTLEHRNHDPQRTQAAEAANAAMQQELEKLRKKGQLSTETQRDTFRNRHDWALITQQDPETWDRIFTFLES